MGIPKSQRFEHAEVRVRDLNRALEFYVDVMGLHEIAREDGVVYLGCGLDENYDLAVREGGTGVSHFAIRITDEDEFEQLERQLKDGGITATRRDGAEPGQVKALRLQLPSGHEMEFVMVADTRYLEPYRPAMQRLRGVAPLDLDHINLKVPNVKEFMEFMVSALGFRLSDVSEPEPGNWVMAWSRYGNYHHDVGATIAIAPHETLHHVAWSMSGIEHIKTAADQLAAAGIKLEMGPSRHPVGSNLFVYFWEPGGNRFEFSAEGAVLDRNHVTRFWSGGLKDTLDAWGQLDVYLPETFRQGS